MATAAFGRSSASPRRRVKRRSRYAAVGGDGFVAMERVRVFVDGFSLPYLNGVTIDYVSSMQGSGFTFHNPNATGGCGCGSSFTA